MMKHLLLTTIAAVMLMGCGESPPDIPIHEAVRKGNIVAAKKHLAAGADVNAKDIVGKTPLHWAAGNEGRQVAELLIANGADVNAQSEMGTPLHFAAAFGHKEIVELLIAKDAGVNAKSDDGGWAETPLDYAKGKTADLLRKHGGKTSEELKAEGK